MDLRFHQSAFLLGAVLYPTWHFIFKWLMPGSVDSLAGRAIVTAIFLGGFGLTFLRPTPRRLNQYLLASLTAMGLHFAWLLHVNHHHVNYIIGSCVLLTAVNAIFGSWRQMAYFNLVFLVAVALSFRHSTSEISPIVLVGGLATIALCQIVLAFFRSQMARKLRSSASLSSIGEMAGGIVHEINNPLSVILYRAQQLDTLLSKEDPQVTPHTLKMVKSIETTARRIDRIVKGMRTMARDASQDPFISVTVAQLADDTLSICSDRFKINEVQLIIEGERAATVEGRPTQLCQVLLNLLNNAIDALENAPTKQVRLSISRERGEVVLRVSDTGPGIPASVRRKMFRPFFTTKHVGKGTGLGLSISKRIVEEHGGTLVLEPTLETCFTIRLPEPREKALALAA